MNYELEFFKEKLKSLFLMSVELSFKTRNLQDVGKKLNVLSLNGIVLASKINGTQGYSLMTLTGIVSTLPQILLPLLDNLNENSQNLSNTITKCSLPLRRILLLEDSLRILCTRNEELYYMNSIKFNSFIILDEKENIDVNSSKVIANSCSKIFNGIEQVLREISTFVSVISSSLKELKSFLKRVKHIATGIVIESAFLKENKEKFIVLVNNINDMMDSLEDLMDNFIKNINKSDDILFDLKSTGIKA